MASVREELNRIYETNGELTPQAIVDAARPKNAPLHNRFEWDNKVAGEAYRLGQAAELIRECRITYARTAKGPKRVREFVSTYETGASTAGVYRRTEEVLQDPVSRRILLRNLERDLRELEQRYGHLQEYASMLRKAAQKRRKTG